MKIEKSQLSLIKGIKEEEITIILTLFEDYEELTSLTAQDLIDTIEGINENCATGLIKYAKTKIKKNSQLTNTGTTENKTEKEVSTVNSVGVKKRSLRDNTIAKQFGLNATPQYYQKCSNCSYDLTSYCEEENLNIDTVNHCPSCKITFITEQQINCYGCLAKLPASGSCVSCGCSIEDSETVKVSIIFAIKNGLSLQLAKLQNLKVSSAILAQAKQERWIENRERLLTGGDSPTNTNSINNVGSSFRGY